MTVYKPKHSRLWLFDFVVDRKRYTGSTGVMTRRAAEAVERKKRAEAALGQFGAVARMTLDEAAGRYWVEVGSGRGDAADVERRIAVLLELIGKTTPLGEIDQATVATAIEARRGRATVRGKAKGAKAYYPAPATVNRDVIETLRPILRRARTHWSPAGSPHGLPDIDWTDLRMTEPRWLSRIYSDAQRAAWRAACDPELRPALDLLLTYGLRFGELFFPPSALTLDPTAPVLEITKGRKRDVVLHIPIRQDHGRTLAALVGQAKAQKLPHLWFHRQGRRKLVAYTYSQVEYRLDKAATEAGIEGGRRIHGARHHAASTVLKRTGGNLKAVQSLLGHATISSSQRYAHVLIDELRAAIEDPAPAPAAATAKPRARKRAVPK